MIENQTNNEITISVPSTEHAYLLMNIAEHMNCVIQRYYWRSKYDFSYIEWIEPKIDAFNVVVTLRGDNNNLSGIYEVYEQKRKLIDELPKTVTMTEDEIKRYSCKMLQYCEIL